MLQTTLGSSSAVMSGSRSRGALAWLSPALVGAMMVSVSAHAVPVIQALRDLVGVRSFVSVSRASLRGVLGPTLVLEAFPLPVEEARQEPPAAVPLPSEASRPPPPVAQPAARSEPAREARAAVPPAAAQAGETLTASGDREPDDRGMVQGKGAFAGGVTAAGGTATTGVHDEKARGGVVGGAGSVAAPASPPASVEPDRSRVARAASSGWNCPFPPEADEEGKDSGTASIMVTVRADGGVQSVKVVSDSGSGFGAAARRCAQGQRFEPSLDRSGRAVAGETAVFTVRFSR